MEQNIYASASEQKRADFVHRLIHLPYPTTYAPPYTEIPFGEIVAIWAQEAEKILKKKAKGLYDWLSQKAQIQLREKLIRQLAESCSPLLAALLHLAKKENRLEGKTPKERYLFFIEKIFPHPDYLQKVFSSFPPFGRTLSAQTLLWVDQAHEFLTRLEKDRKELERVFSVSGKISQLSLSLSDLHNGNRSVYKLEFENGTLLIYKPKPLRLDQAYNELIERLNELGLEPRLKTYRILDQEHYGWVEFILPRACENKEQVERYFQRFGMLISLMFLFEGTDCHYENVLCCGEDPVLIDLESLFHPTLRQMHPFAELTTWNQSVFRTGFLPSTGGVAQRRMDISPLSAEEEQEIPKEMAQWENVNTDLMQFILVKKKVKLSIPRPHLHGKIVSTVNYIENLLEGFQKFYLLISANQKKVLSLLEPLFHYPVRCVFRPTLLYYQILKRLSAPQIMQSETEVEETMEILSRYSPLKGYSQLEKIVAYEKEALRYCDIPFFLSLPSDCHLYTQGGLLAENCFQEPAKQRIAERILNLNEKDMQKQMQYIHHSLYFLKETDIQIGTMKGYDPSSPFAPISEKEALFFAEEIGQKIIDLAQTLSDESLAWISLELDPKIDRYVFQPLSNNLFSGTMGIALFFAVLGKISKKALYLEQMEKILDRAKKIFYDDPADAMLLTNVGGMIGLGGMIYTFSSIGQIVNDSKYVKSASYLASLLQKKHIEETLSDVISGAAGLILVLLSLYKKTKEPILLEKVKQAADDLIHKAKGMERGIAWPFIHYYLSGFSHGTAGIAYALLKAAEATSEKRFLEAAQKALAFERSLFSPQSQNWADLRDGVPPYSSFNWCHGAIGIGFSRLYAPNPNSFMEEEIAVAIEGAKNHIRGHLEHLCCGDFGRLSFLWDVARRKGREDLREIVLKETTFHVQRFKKTGVFNLYTGLPPDIQNPSFMQGLSGIGYFLLQIAQREIKLPQVLVLE